MKEKMIKDENARRVAEEAADAKDWATQKNVLSAPFSLVALTCQRRLELLSELKFSMNLAVASRLGLPLTTTHLYAFIKFSVSQKLLPAAVKGL
jgi:hypothetical protein